ncbi:MAG: SRPBCC family protein [Actinomycetota bacterium]|nr:SRPBCC family protein [Actinomycetota bacterium]
MSAVQIERTVPTPVDRVWATLTDFAAYGDWIPLTAMRVDAAPKRVGWGFAGKTGLGPVGFLDSMLVTRWQPPADGGLGRFSVRKTGRVLRGWADVTVEPVASLTRVTWREEIVPRPELVGRMVARVTDPVTHRLFAAALDKMLVAAADPRAV